MMAAAGGGGGLLGAGAGGDGLLGAGAGGLLGGGGGLLAPAQPAAAALAIGAGGSNADVSEDFDSGIGPHMSSFKLRNRILWPSEKEKPSAAEKDDHASVMTNLLREHHDRIVQCLAWYKLGADGAAQLTKLESAEEPTIGQPPVAASAGDLQHNGFKVTLKKTEKEFIKRWASQHGVGCETALHLHKNCPHPSGHLCSSSLRAHYIIERDSLLSVVVELALGSSDRESFGGDNVAELSPKEQCCRTQADFIRESGFQLLESLLGAFSAKLNAAQWWDASDLPDETPSAAASGGLLGGGAVAGGKGLLDNTVVVAGANDTTTKPIPLPVQRRLAEMVLHLQGILAIIVHYQIAKTDLVMRKCGLLGEEQPLLIVMIRLLNQTLWGSGRPSLARLIPSDNALVSALAIRVRQLAVLTVVLAIETVEPGMRHVVNTEIEQLQGSGGAQREHGVVRMAWSLHCAKLYASAGENEAAELWQMVEVHWAAAQPMQCLTAVKEMCVGQGVASPQYHEIAFPNIKVYYKDVVHQLLDRMCKYLQVSDPQTQAADMIVILHSVFGGASGTSLRQQVDIPSIMLQPTAGGTPPPPSLVVNLMQHAVLCFPLKMDPLLQVLSVLVGAEPISATMVLKQFCRLRFFCGPHSSAAEHAVTMDPGRDRNAAGWIDVQPFGATCAQCSASAGGLCCKCEAAADSEHRNFIIPKRRHGVDKTAHELEQVLASVVYTVCLLVCCDQDLPIWNQQVSAALWDRAVPIEGSSHNSWNGFVWCKRFCLNVCGSWAQMNAEEIQRSIASEYQIIRTVQHVCVLMAHLCEVICMRHWQLQLMCELPEDWSDDEEDEEEEEEDGVGLKKHQLPEHSPELCMRPSCAAMSGNEAHELDSGDSQYDVVHYEELCAVWNQKGPEIDVQLYSQCIMPTAKCVFVGAARLLQACSGKYSDNQACVASLQLMANSIRMLWATGCSKEVGVAPMSVTMELIGLLHELQLLSASGLGAVATTMWHAECTIGDFAATSALLELLHQLLRSPLHEEWRWEHGSMLKEPLIQLRLALFTHDNCWQQNSTDKHPVARWRLTHGMLILLLDAHAMYVATSSESHRSSHRRQQSASWCAVLQDVDLGAALSKLLVSVLPVMVKCEWPVMEEVIMSLLLLIHSLLVTKSLESVILEHVSTLEASHSQQQVALCDMNSNNNLLSPTPAMIVGEIAKYASGFRLPVLVLALRVLRRLAMVALPSAGDAPPRRLPLHQFLNMGKSQCVPSWKDLIAEHCGTEASAASNPTTAAALLRLARSALKAGSPVGQLLCTLVVDDQTVHDSHASIPTLLQFAITTVKAHKQRIVDEPDLVLQALKLIEAAGVQNTGTREVMGSFVLRLTNKVVKTPAQMHEAIKNKVKEAWAAAGGAGEDSPVQDIDYDPVRQTAVVFTSTPGQAELILSTAAAREKLSQIEIPGAAVVQATVSKSSAQAGYNSAQSVIFFHLRSIVESFQASAAKGYNLQLLAQVVAGQGSTDVSTRLEVRNHWARVGVTAVAIRLTSQQLYRKGRSNDGTAKQDGRNMVEATMPRVLENSQVNDMAGALRQPLSQQDDWMHSLYVSPQLQLSQIIQIHETDPVQLINWIIIGSTNEQGHQGVLGGWKQMTEVWSHAPFIPVIEYLGPESHKLDSAEGWDAWKDTLEQISQDDCVEALSRWMALSEPRKSLTIWLLQSGKCFKSEHDLAAMSDMDIQKEIKRIWNDTSPTVYSLADLAEDTKLRPQLTMQATEQLKVMSRELQSMLCVVHAFVVWVGPSAYQPDLKRVAELFTRAADLIAGTEPSDQMMMSPPSQHAVNTQQQQNSQSDVQYGKWLRHNAKVASMAQEHRALAGNTEHATERHDNMVHSLEQASGEDETWAALQSWKAIQTEDSVFGEFINSVALASDSQTNGLIPANLSQLEKFRVSILWKQRHYIPLAAFNCAALGARLAFKEVDSASMLQELGSVHFLRQRMAPAEEMLLEAWLDQMQLAAHHKLNPDSDLLGQTELLLCVSELSAMLHAINPIELCSKSVTRPARKCIKAIFGMITTEQRRAGPSVDTNATVLLLKTFCNLAGMSHSTLSMLNGVRTSIHLCQLHTAILMTLNSLLQYQSIVDAHELHRTVLSGDEFALIVTRLLNEACSAFAMLPKQAQILNGQAASHLSALCTAAGSLLTTLFTCLSKAEVLKAQAVAALVERSQGVENLLSWLATMQGTTAQHISIVNFLLVLSKEHNKPLSSIPHFAQVLCLPHFSRDVTERTDAAEAKQAHKCWLLLLALATSELRTLCAVSVAHHPVGHDFIKAHADQVKGCLQLMSDPKQRVSVLRIQEAASVFELLMLMCGEQHTMSPTLRADISQLSLHTFHGLVSRVSLMTSPKYFGAAFDWDSSDTAHMEIGTKKMMEAAQHMRTFAQCANPFVIGDQRSPLHVVQSFMRIVHWFFVLIRNVTSVLRLVAPSCHRDATVEAPIFSPSKEAPYGSVSDLTRYLSWVHSIAELLPIDYSPTTEPDGIFNSASDCKSSSITTRLRALLLKMAPRSQTHVYIDSLILKIGNGQHECGTKEVRDQWIAALQLLQPAAPAAAGQVIAAAGQATLTKAEVRATLPNVVSVLASLVGPVADVLHRCGLHAEALEAGWLGWLLHSHANSSFVAEPAVMTSVEHTTALLLSTVSCYVDRGSDKLSHQLTDSDLVGMDPSHNQVPQLWEHVRDVVTNGAKVLSELSQHPACKALLDDQGFSARKFNETYNYCTAHFGNQQSALDLGSCINDAHHLGQSLFPEELEMFSRSPTELADALRQQLLTSHFQQYTFTFDDLDESHLAPTGKLPEEALVKADSLLEYLRLFATEQQQDANPDKYGNTPARSRVVKSWATEDQLRDCLKVCATKRKNGSGYWCSMASALGFPGQQPDALAECVKILGDLVPSAPGHNDPHMTAMEVREWLVRDKLAISKMEIDKQSFSQFVEMMRITLFLCRNDSGSKQDPQKLVGVDLFSMLCSCEAALHRLSCGDGIEPAAVWQEARLQLAMVLKFVGNDNQSQNFEDRKPQFGSLLDPSVNRSAEAVWLLLKQAHAVCSCVVKECAHECAPDVDHFILNPAAGQTDASKEEALMLIPDLCQRCKEVATELRSIGQWKDAARLHRIETTTDFMGVAVEKLTALSETAAQLHRSVSR